MKSHTRSLGIAAAAILGMGAAAASAARQTEELGDDLRKAKLPSGPRDVPHVAKKSKIGWQQRIRAGHPLAVSGQVIGHATHFRTEAHARKFRYGIMTEAQATRKVPILYGAPRSLTKSYFESKRYQPNGARECARRVRQMEKRAA